MSRFIASKWTIFIWINVLWLLGTAALGYTAFTSVPPVGSSNIIEGFKIIFLAIGGLGVVLPTYIAAINSIEARSSGKLERTFSLIAKWDDPLMAEARKFTRELKAQKATLSDNDLVAKIEADPGLKHSIILVLNYFDMVRVSEETKRIDVSLFNRSLGVVMQDYHHRFRPYVERQGAAYLEDWDKILDLSKIIKTGA